MRTLATSIVREPAITRSALAFARLPAKEKRFWEAGAEMALSTLRTDERPSARARFARLSAFCKRLGDRIEDTRIGDVMSEEEAQKAWRASVTPA
jgi:hypothetical protein